MINHQKAGIIIAAGLIILRSFSSNAQLCEGSLGDPIVNITFGAGSSTHGGALPQGITSYTYSKADFPIDGSYTIENSTAGSGEQWWAITDHTGNAGGYMMVVNASISLTDYFYKNTITGLCQGTLYEFAAWVMNLLCSKDLSPPNITFSIEQTDGTVINSYTTGPIELQDSPYWRQFGFYFTTPANINTVVIVMRNTSAGGAPANDIALDDITFRPCGPDVSALISETADDKDTVCEGSDVTVHLQATVSTGYSNPRYQWQVYENGTWQDIPGATSLAYPVSLITFSAGTYQYRLAVGEDVNFSSPKCRVISNVIYLTVESRPVAKYGLTMPVVCANEPVVFIDSSQSLSELSYEWDFGDGESSTDQNPFHFYSQSGIYNTSLIVTSIIGCKDTASMLVTVELLPIPDAKFTVYPTDTSIFYPTITFVDESTGAVNCLIDWGDGTITSCNDTRHDYTDFGTFTVKEIVENAAGCHDTAYATVIIRPEYRFYMPNAFTPDGDGLNDVFKPTLFGVHEYVFRVFDRWGQLLFETNNPEDGWNGYFKGSICPAEVYIYNIVFQDDVENNNLTYSGTFFLLKN